MPISFSSPMSRDGRLRGAGVASLPGPASTGLEGMSDALPAQAGLVAGAAGVGSDVGFARGLQ